MAQCEQCGTEQANPGLCSECSSQTRTVAVSSAATRPESRPTSRLASRPTTQTSLSRFLPGDMLVGRYRIVALLGRGGMGEVYRADDLTLDQPVALKFLSTAVTRDESAVTRFRNEVRIARQVSHPNVCRVYDLAEVDGDYFLSMEYVDGEDLGSLLRRIGRLPEDKGLDIARRLCAGLAAAHERGVLHRDLKPGNVMLDGRGQVLLTDFGLAGIAGEIAGNEVRNGTPAYMAPEQLSGKKVSVRSDIYSLGLVLHEIFTGRKPEDTKTPTSFVRDLDPSIDRVIMRCLERDPSARPKSAIAVAAALPGGDPLAAALAAGETPSPQMVAAAGEGSGLSMLSASLWLGAILLGLIVAAIYSNRVSFTVRVDPPYSPEILRQKARDIISELGYRNPAVDYAFGFNWDTDAVNYAEEHQKPHPDWNRLARGVPPIMRFWYRQAESPLTGQQFKDDHLTPGMVTDNDPPPIESGMIFVELDPAGRLVHFEAMPDQKRRAQPDTGPLDWSRLFRAARLDPARFQETVPEWTFLPASDSRKAWTGSPEPNAPAVRVEAASFENRPVVWTVISPATKPRQMVADAQKWNISGGLLFLVFISAVILIAAPLLARRNLAKGSGDRRGAFRIAVFIFIVQMAIWICRGHFVLSEGTFGMAFIAVATSLFYGALVWATYLAFEPQVRRRWPQTLISWSAVLAGQWRSAVVGRDVLYGVAMGLSWAFFGTALQYFLRPTQPWNFDRETLLADTRDAIASLLLHIPGSIRTTLLFFLLLFVFRSLFKREWLASGVFVLLFTLTNASQSRTPWVEAATALVIYGMIALVVFRVGVLALAVGIFAVGVVDSVPITWDPSAWYFANAWLMYVSIAVLAVAAFRIATRDQPFWQRSLFD